MKNLKIVFLLTVFVAVLVAQSVPSSALGPSIIDPTDESGFTQPVYMASADSGSVVTDDIGAGVPQKIGIYFNVKPAANYTVTIQQGDLCKYHSDRNPPAASSLIIDYAWDRGDDPVDGRVVTKYSFADFYSGAIIKTVNGVVQSTGTACDVALVLAPSWLKLDPNTGKWAGYIQIDGQTKGSIGQAAGSSGYVNAFRLVAPAGATLSFEGNKYFAMDVGGKMVDYGNIVLPFAPDCTALPIGTVRSKSLLLKDPDNGKPLVQPNDFWFTIRNVTTGADLKYQSGSAAANTVHFANAYMQPPSNGDTKFYPKSVSGQRARVDVNFVSGQRYQWIMWNVYDNNTIQFTLPYDSIYYQTACKNAVITPTAKVTNLAGTPIVTANAGTTIRFTNDVNTTNLSNVGAADTFNWSIGGITTINATPALIAPQALAGGKIPAASAVYDYPIPAATPNGTVICRRTTVGFGNVTYPKLGPTAQACVTVNGPPPVPGTYDVVTSAPSHEKGSGNKDVTFSLNVTGSACVGNATIVWYGSDGLTNTPDITSTVPCGTAQTYSDPAAKITVPAGTLDGVNGYSYGTYRGYIKTVNGAASPKTGSPQSISIYTVPFTRFFGQDVLVCGDGNVNRFMFDTANALKGSYGEYATIFGANNNPLTKYNGLNSALVNGFPDKLRTTWNTVCGAFDDAQLSQIGVTPVTASSVTINGTTEGTYTNGGDISVTGNGNNNPKKTLIYTTGGDVTISGAKVGVSQSGPLLDNGGVLLIRANNIYIDKNVTELNAVLIADNIYTCANGKTPVAAATRDSECANPLRINGAIYASGSLNLMRTSGTRLLANTVAPQDKQGGAGDLQYPSEVISFPDYLNFVNMPLFDQGKQSFDAYFNVPPRL